VRLRLTIAGPDAKPEVARLGLALVWILGVVGLLGVVFGLSFYVSVRSAVLSNEISVPDLVGLDLEAAASEVKEMELRLQVVDQRHDPAVPSGRVLEQMPRPGSSVRRGRKVRLVVSLGGEVLAVPDLVGQTARAVEIELRREGFVPGDEAHISAPGSRAGTVIGQVPPPGTPAVPSSRVHRLVSDGPAPVTWVMPDLIGLTSNDAERWIAGTGFRRGAVRRVSMGGWPSGTVVGQLPLPGYPVRDRDVVELTVAQ
jgi:beta-lactam-binding protein with PASTA domain